MTRTRHRHVLGLALIVLGVSCPASTAIAIPDQLTLVSRGHDGHPATGSAVAMSISADGRRVVFRSAAGNLWQGAPAGQSEVYVRDLIDQQLLPISRGDGAAGPLADNNTLWPYGIWAQSTTPDGRSVDFGANLPETGISTGRFRYRRDLAENRTTIVAADDGGRPVSLSSTMGWPAPVGNRYVLFQTSQPVIDAVGAVGDGLYLRDLEVGRSLLVGRATGFGGTPVTGATWGGTSPGGRYVLFASGDGTLTAGPALSNPAGGGFLYLRDVRLGQTILVSRVSGRNGRPIASRMYWYGGFVRGDGCQVTFTATGTDIAEGSPENGGAEVYLRDICRGTTVLVSRADGDGLPAATGAPTGSAPPFDPWLQAMSADGRYVLFGTTARNLTAQTTTGQALLYLRDVIGKRTILVSRDDGPSGAPAASDLFNATMTPDARYIVFTSGDRALAPDSTIDAQQAYRRELAPLPPAPEAVQTCGAVDDPGIGGTPAPPCPTTGNDSEDDNNGTSGGGLPPTPKPVAVTVTLPSAPTGSATTPDVPALAGEPTLIRAPTLSAVTATAAAVRLWVDLPATIQVAVDRQAGRRWQRLRTLKVAAAKAGRVRVQLSRLTRARYRVTIRALGAAGTESPAIVRTIDLRTKRTKKP